MRRDLGFSLIILLLLLIAMRGFWVLYGYTQKYPENQLNKKIVIEGFVASLVDRDKAVSKFLFATKDGLIRLSVYPNKNLRLSLRDMESGTRSRVDKVGVASFPARDVP